MATLIAITGGIGSGKSVVSHILRANSYNVYDCDNEARRLMDQDHSIHARLVEHIHPDAVKNGVIDRPLLSRIVFSDSDKLQRLNDIVHGAVIDDIKRQADNLRYDRLFIETAILYQSNIDLMVDEVWDVTAPIEIRINRVITRNQCSREDVLSRINAQDSYTPPRHHDNTHIIINDNITPLLPQVLNLLK